MNNNACQHFNADVWRWTTLEQEEEVGDMVARPTTVVVVVVVLVNVTVTSSEVEVGLVTSGVAEDVLLVSLVVVLVLPGKCGLRVGEATVLCACETIGLVGTSEEIVNDGLVERRPVGSRKGISVDVYSDEGPGRTHARGVSLKVEGADVTADAGTSVCTGVCGRACVGPGARADTGTAAGIGGGLTTGA